MLRLVALVLIVTSACGSKKATCVEGQSSPCACPNGGSGAQLCTSDGSFAACSCGGSGATADSKCSLAALKCEAFSTQGRTGIKLHELVYAARTAGRHAEAICLAENNNNSDGWLLGATRYERSNAFEALGCHALAVSEIEAALTRPRDQSWQATCDWCRQVRANCSPCDLAASERIPCPSNGQLAMNVRDAMLKRAPPNSDWTDPQVDMCIPIGLPRAGWFAIGWVHQLTPDRQFWFNIAVDAKTSKVVAISEPEQRKYNYGCETKFGTVADSSSAPSKVSMHLECLDKYGNKTIRDEEAEIVGSKIVLHTR